MHIVGVIAAIVTVGSAVSALWISHRYRRLRAELVRDPLTGVGNRRGFESFIEQHRDQHIAMVMIDFDHFKSLNDQHGHAAGDAALQRIASTLQRAMAEIYGRRSHIFRLGGDEFVVTIEGADSMHAAAAIEHARRTIDDVLEPHEQVLTLSSGIASVPEHSKDPEHLASYADRALYHAKSSGRNRTVSYFPGLLDESMSSSSREVLRILSDALAAAVDAKDSYTHAHSHNVSDLSYYIARVMGFDDVFVEEVTLGALLHDIGKIGISDQVLRKPGPLSDEEWVEVQSHTEIGFRILSGIQGAERIRDMVLFHHERTDGTGYPRGLVGDEIPMAARIICVADAFDCMTADRVYQQQRTPEEALDEILRCTGTQFDPQVVDALCQLMVYERPQEQSRDHEFPVDDPDVDAQVLDEAA